MERAAFFFSAPSLRIGARLAQALSEACPFLIFRIAAWKTLLEGTVAVVEAVVAAREGSCWAVVITLVLEFPIYEFIAQIGFNLINLGFDSI